MSDNSRTCDDRDEIGTLRADGGVPKCPECNGPLHEGRKPNTWGCLDCGRMFQGDPDDPPLVQIEPYDVDEGGDQN